MTRVPVHLRSCTRTGCWLAQFSDTPCDGQLIRAHLLPKQKIRQEINARRLTKAEKQELYWDPRCWVPACGGPTGIGGHHGLLDGLKLTVPRAALPEGLEEFAAELGLSWWLDRTYGPTEDGSMAA